MMEMETTMRSECQADPETFRLWWSIGAKLINPTARSAIESACTVQPVREIGFPIEQALHANDVGSWVLGAVQGGVDCSN